MRYVAALLKERDWYSTADYLARAPHRGNKARGAHSRWHWTFTSSILKAHVFETPLAAQKRAVRLAAKRGLDCSKVAVWSIDEDRVHGRKVWPIDDIVDAVAALDEI